MALRVAGDKLWCGHFHDTRGLALANVYAAFQLGVPRFDALLAGIGGCPNAPGASGNASTEGLAFMLAAMGVDTGIDLPALLTLRTKVAGWLAREQTNGAHTDEPGRVDPVRAQVQLQRNLVARTVRPGTRNSIPLK